MLTKRLYAGSVSALLVLTLAGCDAKNEPAAKQVAPQATQVQVITMAKKPTTIFTELPGRIVSTRVAEVRPQVTGILQKRLFEEGQLVHQGDVLYQIDPSPYQADVNSAKAAFLKAQADESVTKKTAMRYKDLVKRKLISQEDYDTADGNWKQAKAQSAVAQAALDNANISLSYAQVKAPITGRIDISTVTEGALVTSNQETALTSIEPLDPIYVDMTQSSLSMAKIKKSLGSNTNPSVAIKLEDGSQYAQKGTLTFSGTKVDKSTGSVTLRAKIPNAETILLPGMFVRAQIITADKKPMYTLPQSLIVFAKDGTASVLVVEKNKVAVRPVTIGQTVHGTDWVMTSGLNDGDKVIENNLLRIRPGMEVSVVTAKADPAAPSNSAKK